MATLKLGLLPKLKNVSAEQETAAYIGKRFPVPIAQEAFFAQLLRLEQRRTERSGRPFMLMLIEGKHEHRELYKPIFNRVTNAISSCTRETDILGWYKQDVILGLLMTEISCTDAATIALLSEKIRAAIQQPADAEFSGSLNLVFRTFPQSSAEDSITDSSTLLLSDLAIL